MAGEKAPAAPTGVSSDSKLFGALAYLLSIITGIIVYLMKKDDPYARFHAMQSILTGVVLIVGGIVLAIVFIVLAIIPVVGLIIGSLLSLVYDLVVLVLWLFLMWKAYSGEKFKLPIIGDQAEKMAG